MGLLHTELTEENQILIDLYNKIIDPTNYSIDWESYFMFCYLDDYPNWKDNQEIILHIRKTTTEYRDKRYESEKERNNKKLNSGEDFERIKKVNY